MTRLVLHSILDALHIVPNETRTFTIPVRIRRQESGDKPRTFFLLRSGRRELEMVLRNTDERLLRHFEFALLCNGSVEAVAVRIRFGGHPPTPLPCTEEFVTHDALPSVHLPANVQFHPPIRADRLAELLKIRDGFRYWIDADGHRPRVNRMPDRAFRSVDEIVAYTCPPVVPLSSGPSRASPFELLPFVELSVPPAHAPAKTQKVRKPVVRTGSSKPNWLGRMVNRLFGNLKLRPPTPKALPRTTKALPRDEHSPAEATRERDAHSTKWEQRILALRLTDSAEKRSAAWKEMATIQHDSGNMWDAALCWVNAIWDHDHPQWEWFREWSRIEAMSAQSHSVMRTETVQLARLATALVAEIGFSPDPHPDESKLPELLRIIDAHEGEISLRAVWLARTAATKVVGGDPLSLARCRDRLLARLANSGPALERDAPAFLRFHGNANGERFREAREWLLCVRDPIHRWLNHQATDQRFGWAGLDPNLRTTAAYADLMLAWGLSRLGDRTHSDEWSEQAEKTLHHSSGRGVDGQVHATLLARFRERIQSARYGHPVASNPQPRPLDELSRYCVEKLIDRSQILSEGLGANPYQNRDRMTLFGTDSIGERLLQLIRTADPSEVKWAIGEMVLDPTARMLPRVALALAEVHSAIGPNDRNQLLSFLSRAVELLPEAVRLSTAADSLSLLIRWVAWTVVTACRIAGRYDLAHGLEEFLRVITERVRQNDDVVRTVTLRTAGLIFRTLRKLGLRQPAEELLSAMGPTPPAAGWFAAGHDEAGVRQLDIDREYLFVTGIPNERDRTTASLDYVTTLSLAPTKIALDRLSEVFQRLGRIATAGATARYFALPPLEIIDRAVTAVVSDEFDLGPVVRNWLDDDEFLTRKRIHRDLTDALAEQALHVPSAVHP
jgi:hypothetical protein